MRAAQRDKFPAKSGRNPAQSTSFCTLTTARCHGRQVRGADKKSGGDMARRPLFDTTLEFPSKPGGNETRRDDVQGRFRLRPYVVDFRDRVFKGDSHTLQARTDFAVALHVRKGLAQSLEIDVLPLALQIMRCADNSEHGPHYLQIECRL